MRHLFALLVVLIAVVPLAKSDVCVFNKGEFYSYTNVFECFKSILLTDEVKFTTLETLRRTLEVYTFYDIAHQSPDPNLLTAVNLQGGLETIASKEYIFDKDFQDDLRDLFLQLHDAHTQYYAPTCYQNLQIRQGFGPIGFGETPETFQIRVGPYFPADLVDYYKSQLALDIRQYVNYTINTIDGVPAYQYLMHYANTSVGISKDVGTRFNYVFSVAEPRDDISVVQYGYWQVRTRRNPFPTRSSVEYGLISPSGQSSTLSLPWTFLALKTYDGEASWLNDYFFDEEASKVSAASPSKLSQEHAEVVVEPQQVSAPEVDHKQRLLKEAFGEGASQSMTFELLVNSTHLTFWALSDDKTLVIYLDSMAPGLLSHFVRDLTEGFELAAQRGLSNLIIDLSGNGGGNICLGRALLSILQKDGWPGQGQNWGPQDLSLSVLAEQLIGAAVENNVSNSVWSPAFYANQQDEAIANSDTSYLLPGVSHERGGFTRNYTRLVHLESCSDWGNIVIPAINFLPSKTLLVTNGFCGSTCAIFANHLALFDDVRTVVRGGMPGRVPMQYSSFPGGQVMDNDPFFSQLTLLGQNVSFVPLSELKANRAVDVVPRQLPTQASFRFCVREAYPPTPAYDTNPLEFTFQQANYHLFHSELTATFPQYVWYDVLPYFG